MYGQGKLKLRTLLGEYPKTQALRDRTVTSDVIELDIADIAQAPKGFKPMMRELAFDVAEVSIITFLQGKAAGKPYEFVGMSGEDHWLSRAATRQQMLNAAMLFVTKYDPAN